MVLVTGGAGLVGAELIRQLLDKEKKSLLFITKHRCRILVPPTWYRCNAIYWM